MGLRSALVTRQAYPLATFLRVFPNARIELVAIASHRFSGARGFGSATVTRSSIRYGRFIDHSCDHTKRFIELPDQD